MHKKPRIDLTLDYDDMAALELLAEQLCVTKQTWARMHLVPVIRQALQQQVNQSC